MIELLRSYETAFPMAPFAGLFILPVALCILAGAAWPAWRDRLLAVGFALGVTAASLVGDRLFTHLGSPTRLQVASFGVALVAEFAAFALVMKHRPDPRRRVIATLAIVAAHFLIMLPAFGPLIGGMGLVLLANALLGRARPGLSTRRLWLADGAIKLCGAAMLLATATY